MFHYIFLNECNENQLLGLKMLFSVKILPGIVRSKYKNLKLVTAKHLISMTISINVLSRLQ